MFISACMHQQIAFCFAGGRLLIAWMPSSSPASHAHTCVAPCFRFVTCLPAVPSDISCPPHPSLSCVLPRREYFQYSVAVEEQLDPAKPYIIAGCPHGVLPFSQMLCLSGKVRQLAWPG